MLPSNDDDSDVEAEAAFSQKVPVSSLPLFKLDSDSMFNLSEYSSRADNQVCSPNAGHGIMQT